MRLPSARGVLVSLGVASAMLWLTAAAAQAQEPLPAVSLPKAPAAVTTAAKTAAPAVSKTVEAAKPVTAQASSAVTTTVSHAAKSIPAAVQPAPLPKPAPAAKPVQHVEEEGIEVVREVTAPVEQVVEAAAPAPVAAIVNSVEPTVEEVTASIEPVVRTLDRVIEPVESAAPAFVDLGPTESQSDPIAAPDDEAPPVVAVSVDIPLVTAIAADPETVADEGRTADPAVVVEEPEAARLDAPVEPAIATSHPLPISVTPVVEVLDIHDALPVTLTETVIATTWAPLEATSRMVSVGDPSTVAGDPSASLVTASEHAPALPIAQWKDVSPREGSVPAEPWVPLMPGGAAAPASMPATAIGTGTGPPGAAPPARGQLSLSMLWQALRQRTLFTPVSVALSDLAPPG